MLERRSRKHKIAVARARIALEGEDEASMRECAFELARIEQTLVTLLA